MNIKRFEIPYYENKKTISVLLPKNYNINKKYPTLYMSDGQNLFIDEEAFLHKSWQIGNTAKAIIVVGIHSDENRLNEYTPFYNHKLKKGGGGNLYIDWIINKLIPEIDKNFKTNKIRFIAGSSLGSLIALYAILKYPKSFNSAGLFSTSIWFNKKDILKLAKKTKLENINIFISAGTKERENKFKARKFVNETKKLYKILNKKNLKIKLVINEEKHNELAWRKTFILFYQYLTSLKLF